MIRHFVLLKAILLFIVFFSVAACTKDGGKILPMKTYPVTSIPDGEFLHYGVYSGGEKNMNYYYVKKKETNESDGICYRVHYDIISEPAGKRLPENYADWPVIVLIDPARGQTIESTGNLNTNILKDFGNLGVGGLIYWNYKLNREKGEIRYVSKSINDISTNTKNYRININTTYPIMDMISQDFITYRLIDPKSPGIIYFVMPDFMKDPLSISLRLGKKETVKVKAGTFSVNEVIMIAADRFIAKLAEPFLKNSSYWVEDSDRRLIVKGQGLGEDIQLEEISNVNIGRNK